jgi:hypothetical protein
MFGLPPPRHISTPRRPGPRVAGMPDIIPGTDELGMALAFALLRGETRGSAVPSLGSVELDAIKARWGHRIAISAFQEYLRLRDELADASPPRARALLALADAMIAALSGTARWNAHP